jgi:hypothetical protein
MVDHDPSHASSEAPRVNPGYAGLQLARALASAVENPDPEVRERARKRVEQWSRVLDSISSGAIDYGSRVPVQGFPPWVTLEVVTGGFATGKALAGGPLAEDEVELLERVHPDSHSSGRMALNYFFLSEPGQAELRSLLESGRFRVEVPEEGALFVVALLIQEGAVLEAMELVGELEPFFDQLRFYPRTAPTAPTSGSTVYLRSVSEVIEDLRAVEPPTDLLRQREAVTVWGPFLDRVVAHVLETFDEGTPLRVIPEGWTERGTRLVREFRDLSSEHTFCRKPRRASGHFAQLLSLVRRTAADPSGLNGREVGRLRVIVRAHVEKWGEPGSARCRERRARQRSDVEQILFSRFAEVVADRLEGFPGDSGLPEPDSVLTSVNSTEAATYDLPDGHGIPGPIRRRAHRCREDAIDVLVHSGLITSGDTLARLLPQVTSRIHAQGLEDPRQSRVFEAVYRAFRRRRSLLLLDLQWQVRLFELPWVEALEWLRVDSLDARSAAEAALADVVVLQLSSFPQAIIPNTLLREVGALADSSHLDVPLVEELAADIFMGRFSRKFGRAAAVAASLLQGSLYETYYGIDWPKPLETPPSRRRSQDGWGDRLRSWPSALAPVQEDAFGPLCYRRAGVEPGGWDVVENGMVIEQAQILTTQNLAVLYSRFELGHRLSSLLVPMAEDCLRWIMRRQQQRIALWPARLRMLKNTAYAWRQMIFYLSLADRDEVGEFFEWGTELLHDQRSEYRQRFGPVWKGLLLAMQGITPPRPSGGELAAVQFLGWTRGTSRLLPADGD